ncbi:VWA domain-containing protein [Domibacillus enclensis]|uniref:Ig-like domain (Group 2) n=1 Tax=Domibacillus enclensis TaxID=1017273 RepID=A0A1N6Q1A5_9BACI|nr:VWA domain-containing protein [Domibacillus enclensis]OXS80552.1 hypothetical protein B1B05_03465 [Domibacillus enclensis]SIQ10361.1 Ig-like domain (group 2) [Domibacillus enclensis]
MKKYLVNVLLSIIAVLLIMPHGALQTKAAANDIGVSVTAAPSQTVVVKPVDSNAQARIDMKLMPYGKYDQLARKPVDVVFVFDTSGSMNESGKRPEKFRSAKDAMYKALEHFKKTSGPNDRFAFIPFNTNVDTGNMINIDFGTGSKALVEQKLNLIADKVKKLEANGGTNYREPMEQAEKFLSGSSNEKNIIFMTDGELTVSKEKTRYCGWFNCYEDGLNTVLQYTNGSFGYYSSRFGNVSNPEIYDGSSWLDTSYSSERKKAIELFRINAKKQAQLLGSKSMKMYSIGFGNNSGELDQEYLEELSSVTGAYASRASEGNVDQIFLDIAESISKQKLDAEITLDLAKFNGKVTVAEGANAAVEGTNITLRKSFEYEYLQNAPAPVDLTLPLEFSEVGTYTFDNMKLSFKRPDGSTSSVTIPAVTITVSAEAPPAIDGSMTLKGEDNTVNSLIKQAGTRGNYFSAEYNLKPKGLTNNSVSGKLQNMKLVQPLPNGVSIDESASNVTVRDSANGDKEAVVTLTQTVSYGNGVFTPPAFTAALKLKTDWALNNVTMPQAKVEYEDTRFKKTYTSTIPSASERITSKVRLDDGASHYYDGYANGTIRKVTKALGVTAAETTFPNDYGLQPKPIKDLVFAEGSDKTAVTVTYSDNTTALIRFVADLSLTGKDSGASIQNGDTVQEHVNAKVSQLVAGEDVLYFYRVNGSVAWLPMTKDFVIPLTKTGLNTVEVKSTGGFSLADKVTKKEVTIQKKVESIEIWSTGKNPVQLSGISAVEGASADFLIKVLPEDATDRSWTAKIEDGSIAEVLQDNEQSKGTIIGLKEGSTELTVVSNSNPNVSVTIPVIVESAFVELEGVSFKQAKYTNKSYEQVDQLIEFTPEDATDPEIVDVRASSDGVVSITEPSEGEFYIEAAEGGTGYTNVTVTVEQTQPDGSTETKKATAVFETGENSGGESAESIDGRW